MIIIETFVSTEALCLFFNLYLRMAESLIFNFAIVIDLLQFEYQALGFLFRSFCRFGILVETNGVGQKSHFNTRVLIRSFLLSFNQMLVFFFFFYNLPEIPKFLSQIKNDNMRYNFFYQMIFRTDVSKFSPEFQSKYNG